MTQTDQTDPVAATASALLMARASGTRVALAPSLRPSDIDQVYAVQRAVCDGLWTTSGIAAWKVGASGPTDPPNAAPIGAPQVLESGARIEAGRHLRGIEGELAFRLARDLAPLADDAGDDAVLDAIACVHPAIEVVDSRLADFESAEDLTKLADFQSHGALVLGAPIGAARALDVATQAARLRVNGSVHTETVGGNAARDLLRLLRWLSRHAAEHFGGLRAGQVVTTGTFTGLVFLEPGDEVEVSFPGFGSASVTFAGRTSDGST